MDPPEQRRLPMFIVGSMRASEFDVFVVGAGGQLRVSDAFFFVAGDRLPVASRSLLMIFPLVHQQGIASSASTRPIVSPVSSPRRSRLEGGKLHAYAKFKAVFAAIRTLIKFVFE